MSLTLLVENLWNALLGDPFVTRIYQECVARTLLLHELLCYMRCLDPFVTRIYQECSPHIRQHTPTVLRFLNCKANCISNSICHSLTMPSCTPAIIEFCNGSRAFATTARTAALVCGLSRVVGGQGNSSSYRKVGVQNLGM